MDRSVERVRKSEAQKALSSDYSCGERVEDLFLQAEAEMYGEEGRCFL